MNNEYLNDVASRGALLGALMLVSHIIEQKAVMAASSSIAAPLLILPEMLVVVVLYIYLLYRFARRASQKFGDDVLGYTYAQGLIYVWAVAVFAGIIVGFGRYVFVHFIVGYDNYIEQLIASVQSIMAAAGTPTAVGSMYDAMFANMSEQTEPSVISTIFSSVCSYGFWGMIVGLFIAGGVKREPKLFDDTREDDTHEEI